MKPAEHLWSNPHSQEPLVMLGRTSCHEYSILLRRQGWTVEEGTLGVEGPINPVLVVWGHNGVDRIRTHGGTRDEAWRLACEFAAAHPRGIEGGSFRILPSTGAVQ